MSSEPVLLRIVVGKIIYFRGVFSLRSSYRIFFSQSRQATIGGKNLVRIFISSSGLDFSQNLHLKVIFLVPLVPGVSFLAALDAMFTSFLLVYYLPGSYPHHVWVITQLKAWSLALILVLLQAMHFLRLAPVPTLTPSHSTVSSMLAPSPI